MKRVHEAVEPESRVGKRKSKLTYQSSMKTVSDEARKH
jgi:hypothetical protein